MSNVDNFFRPINAPSSGLTKDHYSGARWGRSVLICASLVLVLAQGVSAKQALFSDLEFTQQDAILIQDVNGRTLFEWQKERAMLPASLVKMLTALIAINTWGLDHRFHTDFYLQGKTLWVKGFGDPYLVSEEIDLIVLSLNRVLEKRKNEIEAIAIDGSYFSSSTQDVPGRSKVDDPYNAPLSAVSANFNTVFLKREGKQLLSAENQTPITSLAKGLVASQGISVTSKKKRINLLNANNAQRQFGEILAAKLQTTELTVQIEQPVPSKAEKIYRHYNSHTLADVLLGMMTYSNNFIANQLFIKFSERDSLKQAELKPKALDFGSAVAAVNAYISDNFSWQNYRLEEGSGLSRNNRLSAKQAMDLVTKLAAHKQVFKQYVIGKTGRSLAKTGTLQGVSNIAGSLESLTKDNNAGEPNGLPIRYVFLLNRPVDYDYRHRLLEKLNARIHQSEAQ